MLVDLGVEKSLALLSDPASLRSHVNESLAVLPESAIPSRDAAGTQVVLGSRATTGNYHRLCAQGDIYHTPRTL